MFRLAIVCLSALLTSANLNGSWTGDLVQKGYDGKVAFHGPAYLRLQQEGQTITGEVGPDPGHSHSIENVSFSGGTLKFQTHYTDTESKETVRWRFDLTVHGDSMEGSATGERETESPWTVEIKLARHEP